SAITGVQLNVFYGGTSDPIHFGHLAVATAAQQALQSTIHFLPSADPPHRAITSACAQDRANMVELAIAHNPYFKCDRRELYGHGKSYSFDTLNALRTEYGSKAPIIWLMGMDSFLGLTSWYHWRELFSLCHFAIAPRPEHGVESVESVLQEAIAGRWVKSAQELQLTPSGSLYLLPMVLREESATRVRMGFQQGERDNPFLPASVAEYIKTHQLYASGV
ncbi:MAG TPA: nicotinate-nucleotide adenylyltransferase, partial [Arenimonas sp.]|nr:nicotinate-nucleotide adenylyltransferase [Arenimonas sp.]